MSLHKKIKSCVTNLLCVFSLSLFAVAPFAADKPDTQALKTRLAKLEQLLQKSSEYQRYLLLDTAARTAFELGQFNKAKTMTDKLQQLANKYSNDWNYGTAMHQAHIISGRIALQKNDLDSAKKKLLAAGSVTASESLSQYGPDFNLANELLARGETTTVANYLQKCKKIWRPGREQLNNWLKSLGQGNTPQLGGTNE